MEASIGRAMDGPPPAGALVLRPMSEGDVPAVLGLAHAEGRNVTAADYERFLALEGSRGLVVERDGVILGAGTAMRYFEHGFLGPLVLRSGADAAGLAVAILAHLVEILQRDGVGVLDAEAARTEEAILARMGFQIVRRTIVLERPAGDPATSKTTPMEGHHLLDVGALDASAAGFGRKEYLAALREALPAGARIVGSDHEVEGFVLVRRASRGLHLGPLVTREGDVDGARELVRAAVSAAPGEPVVALVPDAPRVIVLFESEGFREVGRLARMRAGTPALPPATATEWAIGGRITG